jgi:hypothetical protein
MQRKVTMHEEKILDSWSIMIKGAQGKAGEIFEKTIKYIEEANIPTIQYEMVEVSTDFLTRIGKATIAFATSTIDLKKTAKSFKGIMKGVTGIKAIEDAAEAFAKKKREYLMVTNATLKDYRMYIGARDYGNHLDVSWYLTCEPGFFKKALSALTTGSDKVLSFALDLFDQQDLQAYVTVVHHCLLEAVSEIMLDLNQDPSKIERKSRGFLGVS